MSLEPAIYRGTLRHRRFHPKRHEFSYPVFMAFLDIDRIPETMGDARFAAYNRFNWASFHEKDHFGDASDSLRSRLAKAAHDEGVAFPGGPVYLLTNLRYLGYCFNPISLFYCFGRNGEAPLVMAEVSNTFGERKNYWLGPHNRTPGENSLRFRCAKDFHVSPFMGMGLEYDFVFTEPLEKLVVHINTLDAGQPFFDATLTLDRQPWTSGNLTRALVRHPWMTAQVIAAIHWEAVRLWWKNVPVYAHPARRKSAA